MNPDPSQNIRDRAFTFACAVARLALAIPPRPGARIIIDQLLRSATSIGANLEEAKAAVSDRDFLHTVQTSLKEAREACYWLRVCAAIKLGDVGALADASGEAEQIARILAAIVISRKRRMMTGYVMFAFCILNFALHVS